MSCKVLFGCFYRGVTKVDIPLTNVDINQCDDEWNLGSSVNMFRGTHHCHASTRVTIYSFSDDKDVDLLRTQRSVNMVSSFLLVHFLI